MDLLRSRHNRDNVPVVKRGRTQREATLVVMRPLNFPAILLGLLAISTGSGGTRRALAEEVVASEATPTPTRTTQTTRDLTEVLLFPAQPIYRAVSQAQANTITDLLAKELEASGGVAVLRAGAAKIDAKSAPGNPVKEDARAAVVSLKAAAAQAEGTRAIERAIELRGQIITLMSTKSESIETPDDLVLAHHDLARVLMWAGRDDEARHVLLDAARMHPALVLPPDRFSRLYRRWFQAAVSTALDENKGELLVRSVIPGATIFLDGHSMDVAPVLIKGMTPGHHILTAQAEGVAPFAAIVEVKPKARTEFTVTFGETIGGAIVGAVSDSVAENTINEATVQGAAEAGKNAGASFVVLTGVTKDDERINVHTFVVRVAERTIETLDIARFDLDLLTAESDVLRIVQAVRERMDGSSAATASARAPRNVVGKIDARAVKVNLVNEMNALAARTKTDRAGTQRGKTGSERVIFRPLQGGTVRIKDDEEE